MLIPKRKWDAKHQQKTESGAKAKTECQGQQKFSNTKKFTKFEMRDALVGENNFRIQNL